MGFSDSKPKTANRNNRRLSDDIDSFEFPDGDWVTVRFIGPMTSFAYAWINIMVPKGAVKIPKVVTDYDPSPGIEDFVTSKKNKDGVKIKVKPCPYRTLPNAQVAQNYLCNFIVRDLQDNEPKKKGVPTDYEKKPRLMLGEKWKIKEVGSKTWTPVRANSLSSSLVEKLGSLKQINKHVSKKDGSTKFYDVTDPKYGRDVMIKYNAKGTGSGKWDVQIDKKSPLTEEEMDLLIYKLDNLPSITPDPYDKAVIEADNLSKKLVSEDKKSSKGKSDYLDDEDDVEDDDDDKPKKKKKKPVDEDEDDDDDDKPKKKKKKPVDEDDDDDDDKPKKKKKKPVDDDDDDIEEF